MPKTALVLAGHGSHITPQTAGLIWSHVDALRALGVADEIAAAFWKEQPSFSRVLNSLSADDITVIPLFTAQGYFTQTVIPAEMGLSGAVTRYEGKTIRYAKTLSEHPYLFEVVRRRVDEAFLSLRSDPAQTAIAVIGHSTRRNPESRRATEAQADALRRSGVASEVVAVFLDDSPSIPEVYDLTHAPTLIAVPYFLALGSHTTIDVPEALGLSEGQQEAVIEGRRVLYTPPVGIDADLRQILLALARDAGAPLYSESDGDGWAAFPREGRERLAGYRGRFGQLDIQADRVQVWGDEAASQRVETPAALRALVRETPFRPLMTSNDLSGGWFVPYQDVDRLHAILETVYPGCVAEWAAYQEKGLLITSLSDTARRQTGMYQQLENFPAANLVAEVCGGCVRVPLWHDPALSIKEGGLPCPEPCNWWMTKALESDDTTR